MNSASKQSGSPGAARSSAAAGGGTKSTAGQSGRKKAEPKQTISPLERWRMVTEAAYYHAQKRGLLGGNPMEDWLAAEKEIDAKYTVDYGKIMAAKDPTEMLDHFTKAFSRIHLPGVGLEAVMDAQRKNIEALSDANQLAFEGARDLTKRQMQIFRETVDEAAAAVKEMKAVSSPKDLPAKQAKLMKDAVHRALANMRELADIATESRNEAINVVKGRTKESIEEIKQLVQKARA